MRELGRNSVRMLLYHRFPEAARASLEAQCMHLRGNYNPIRLSDVARWLKDGDPLPPNSLAVTVDDGYRDFYTTAYPIFSAYRIPVMVFLTTDFLDKKCWLWVDRLKYAVWQTQFRKASLALDGQTIECHFTSIDERSNTLSSLKAVAKRMSNAERIRFVSDLPTELGVSTDASLPPDYQPMDWDEVRQMAANGIDFGAHTKTHPILSSLAGPHELEEEIVGSKKRIEMELDREVPHFSYPNGTWDDVNPETVRVVRESGFQTAVLAQGGLNSRETDRFLLRRNTVEPDAPVVWFGRHATGFRRA